MKRRFIIGFFIAVIALTIAVPALAYLYRAPLTIASNYTDYTALPVTCLADVDWLITNGFITTSTALDTRVETLGGTAQKHMMADDRIMVFCPTLNGYSQLNWYLTTGNSALTSFPIIVGDGGNVTITDHADLELANNFSVEFEGYVRDDITTYPMVLDVTESTETTEVTNHDVTLPGTINVDDLLIMIVGCYDPTGGSPTVGWPAGWTQLDKNTMNVNTCAGVAYRVADGTEGATVIFTTAGDSSYSAHRVIRIDHYQGVPEISAVAAANSANPNSANLASSWGGINGTLYLSVFGGGDTALRTYTSCPSGYWSGGMTTALGVGADYAYAANAERGECSASDDPGQYVLSGNIMWMAWTVGVEGEDKPLVYKQDAFQIYISDNITGMIDGTTPLFTGGSYTGGSRLANVWANTTDFGIDIDGLNEDSVALGGASVPGNANDWLLSAPYFDYYTHNISGAMMITYEPDDVISGTTLVNEESPGTHDGIIAWGTNPPGVTAVLGALTVPETTVTAEEEAGGYQSAMHEVEVTDWFLEPDVGTKLAAHPLRPLITIWSDNSTVTEVQAWRFLGLALLLLITVVAAVMLRGHLLIAGLACGGTIAVLVQQTIWPAWTLVFIIPAIIAGVMAERTPSIG